MVDYIEATISFIRDYYECMEFIPLYEPKFTGNEKECRVS